MSKILLVEDEDDLALLLRYNFEKQGDSVLHVAFGEEALPLALQESPDLIILDWMLPNMSGVDVCKMLRQEKVLKNIPVLMLTARGTEADKLAGFTAGVDDYLTKPFSLPELMARMQALLRRYQRANDILSYQGIVLDIGGQTVVYQNQLVPMGPTEFRLLKHFLSAIGRPFSRADLQQVLWDNDDVDLRTVDVYVKRLRSALAKAGTENLIHTIRSVGYVLK